MAKPRAKQATRVKLVGRDKQKNPVLVKLAVDGKKLIVSTGSTWGSYKDKTKTFGTPAKALEAYANTLAAKREEGFREIGELRDPEVPIARDAKLEAAIRANRDDDGAYMIYADWLQGQGSPLGDLIAYAQRGKQKQANAIATKIGLPPDDFATRISKHGLWQQLRIHNEIDNSDADWDPLPAIEKLFASPLCAVLEDLRIGMVRWDDFDQPAIIEAAGTHAWAKDLRSFSVGDVGGNIDMNHHSIGDVGKRITKAFPKLESLFIRSGEQAWRGKGESFGTSGLSLPTLKKLVVHTCRMTTKRLKSFLGAAPNATFVELWFGDPQRGEPLARTGDLMPVLNGTAFPKVEHLGLCNSAMVTDIVRFLPTTRIAKQLTELDLSRGTMSDDDAIELAAEAKAFPKLRQLDVSRSWLTGAGIKALKKAFPGVKLSAEEQDDPATADEDYGGRYVRVGE